MNKKVCKGKGLARGSGCSDEHYLNPMHKGLCSHCYPKWLLNSENGKAYFDKVKLKSKRNQETIKRKEKTQQRRAIMSTDAYRAKVLQPVINEIARLIDYGQPCIATRKFGKMAGGHRKSVGSNRGIALNLHNIHIQCFQSNSYNGGDERKYDIGIVEEYGEEYLDYLISLENHTAKFSKAELEDAFNKAKEFRLDLRKHKTVYVPIIRIHLRNKANAFIGLYDSIEPFYKK